MKRPQKVGQLLEASRRRQLAQDSYFPRSVLIWLALVFESVGVCPI